MGEMMIYVPRLYLETTVFNFYYTEKARQKRDDAQKLFIAIVEGKYEVYTSNYVLKELEKAPKEKAEKMLNLVEKYVKDVIPFNNKAEGLADLYIANHIIPLKHRLDALHIAAATVSQLDFVVSYNFGHIVKPKTIAGAGFINLQEGYRQIGLCTPTEVVEYAP
jgi:hypothetical protein